MKAKEVVKNKIIIFFIQIATLTLLIYLFNYEFKITYDDGILPEREIIIQFLGNYVLYNDFSGFMFIFSSWLGISFIPIVIYSDYKKAYSMNLTTFFFPNFFFYVFLSRYSPTYFGLNFQGLLTQTIIIAFFIVGLSIGISIPLKRIKTKRSTVQDINIKQIEMMNKSKCPHCGTEFNSIPKYCYNCSKEIN